MKYDYYYNNVPGVGLTRNNLIYTSLISEDQRVFVKWYHNDTAYHDGKNEVVDPSKMEEKWQRELKYLKLMRGAYPDLVPNILDIDEKNKKIYLGIDGADFWNKANCTTENYDNVLPDWQDQMINIVKAHKSLNLHKYSMHPSSYFLVDGRLKSINYFFTYEHTEPHITIEEVQSHIHTNRQNEMKKHLTRLGIAWDEPQQWELFDTLCWESFSTNYPSEFIKRVQEL